MDALEALLRPAADILNRKIRETTPARALCAELDGTLAAIRIRDTGLAMYISVGEDSVSLATEADDDPDIAISGSIVTLARVAAGGDVEAVRGGSLDLIGDARRAQAFQRLLGYAKPDIEEGLSRIVGDAAAHSIGEAARGLRRWARGARTTMGENVREYLTEESRDVPSRYEVERFGRDVNRLRDAVDRAEARLRRLEERR